MYWFKAFIIAQFVVSAGLASCGEWKKGALMFVYALGNTIVYAM
jgi:hypothetical protein